MHVRAALRQLWRWLLHAAVRRRAGGPPLLHQAMRRRRLLRPVRRLRGLHALARHALHQARRGRGSCAAGPVGGSVHLQRRPAGHQHGARGPDQCRRCVCSPVRQLRHHFHPALEERATRTKVVVQCVWNPVQERGEARCRRRCGADGASVGQRDGVRVRVRAAAAAAAVGMLRPGRGQDIILRDVRRRGPRGWAVPAVGARRHALVAGVRNRPGDDKPVPVLLASYSRSSLVTFFSPSPLLSNKKMLYFFLRAHKMLCLTNDPAA